MKKIWLFLFLSSAPSIIYSCATIPPNMSAYDKKDAYDVLDTIKLLVQDSSFHLKDWNKYPHDSQDVIEATSCTSSTNYLIEHLIGQLSAYFSYKSAQTLKIAYEEFPPWLAENSFYGTFTTLFEKKESRYTNILTNQLFLPIQDNNHFLFYILINHGEHALIIEQKNTPASSFWRIYQSWHKRFSLAQWIGLDPWISHHECLPDPHSPFTDQFEKYGRGQKLNQEQIINFMKELPNFLRKDAKCPDLRNRPIYIKKYAINPTFIRNIHIQSKLAMATALGGGIFIACGLLYTLYQKIRAK